MSILQYCRSSLSYHLSLIKIFVLSIFVWPFTTTLCISCICFVFVPYTLTLPVSGIKVMTDYTGFTVHLYCHILALCSIGENDLCYLLPREL